MHTRTRYNLLVGKLAAIRIFARHLDVSVGSREHITLREVVDRFGAELAGGWSEDSDQLPMVIREPLNMLGNYDQQVQNLMVKRGLSWKL
jgi:hypothetical protein